MAQIKSLGVVAGTAGTPARATANQASPTAEYPCHAIMVEQFDSNTGKLYILDSSTAFNGASSTNLLATLPIPSTSVIASWSATGPPQTNSLDASKVWIEPSVNGDDAIVSVIVS